MTPDEREFGILIGKVEGIGEQIAELRRVNTQEHAANAQRFERLETSVHDALAEKADKIVVNKHSERLRSLETIRDEGKGAARLVRFVQGALGAAVVVLGYVASHGGIR